MKKAVLVLFSLFSLAIFSQDKSASFKDYFETNSKSFGENEVEIKKTWKRVFVQNEKGTNIPLSSGIEKEIDLESLEEGYIVIRTLIENERSKTRSMQRARKIRVKNEYRLESGVEVHEVSFATEGANYRCRYQGYAVIEGLMLLCQVKFLSISSFVDGKNEKEILISRDEGYNTTYDTSYEAYQIKTN